MKGFLIGLGIGVGIGLLFAPLAGEDAREWLAENTGDKVKQLRRQGRRLVYQAQDVLDRGQDTVSRVLKNSKTALDSVASVL